MKIITLTTCHNRKSKTLTAIHRLHNQNNVDNIDFEHVVVDDGSTDGTYESLVSEYPDIKIIRGNGKLFWSGGMRHGFDQAIKKQNYDYLLLYNDDVEIYLDAVSNILNHANTVDLSTKPSVFVGSTIDSNGKTSYGGCVKKYWFHPLEFMQIDPSKDESLIEVETLNMNFCLIPRNTIENIGFLKSTFQHSGSDYEYGLYLRKKGGQVLLVPGYYGECNRNSYIGTSKEPNISIKETYIRLLSLKERDFLPTIKYSFKYGGIWGLSLTMLTYINILFKKYYDIR